MTFIVGNPGCDNSSNGGTTPSTDVANLRQETDQFPINAPFASGHTLVLSRNFLHASLVTQVSYENIEVTPAQYSAQGTNEVQLLFPDSQVGVNKPPVTVSITYFYLV